VVAAHGNDICGVTSGAVNDAPGALDGIKSYALDFDARLPGPFWYSGRRF